MDLGEKILNLRKKEKLSQEQLAEKLNVTRQTISNWETGETKPDIEQSKMLAKVFKISLDELTDNDNKDILVEKMSNTEKLAGLILKLLKIGLIVFLIFIVLIIFIALMGILFYSSTEPEYEVSRILTTSITCSIFDEEYNYELEYYEETGELISAGGDAFFPNVLNLEQYTDGYQVADIIDAYAKENGGSCEIDTKYSNEE